MIIGTSPRNPDTKPGRYPKPRTHLKLKCRHDCGWTGHTTTTTLTHVIDEHGSCPGCKRVASVLVTAFLTRPPKARSCTRPGSVAAHARARADR